ncbi:alpha-1-macroglobulin-like isoform X2 [Physella acuta]|uniref:alpha-1-macroglobulin-like isoform X2 n=1 Tax=Physella acuta TaxID=109671 RepID=UPI0027DE9AA2|nr:alpha-1-macroglobulin-like isoform X2 [Physella acuta]
MDACRRVVFVLLIWSIETAADTTNKYLFTMPKILRHGTTPEFCLTFYGSEGSEPATLRLVPQDSNKPGVDLTDMYQSGEQICRSFSAPPPGDYELQLYKGNNSLNTPLKVTVFSDKIITLVQTDKPVYKPGQKVMFRVFTLMSDLKARVGKIKSIYISDPNDIRVKQFADVDHKGISSFEFELAAEAKLGKWKIEVNVDQFEENNNRGSLLYFTVEEYVLPRFEVVITPPSYLLITDETIQGKVCAKYTYGKPVKGLLELRVCWEKNYLDKNNKCHQEAVEINGCYTFTANTSKVLPPADQIYYGGSLSIHASVTEKDTAFVVSKTHSGLSLTHEPLEITLKDFTKGYFKPGLPFYGKIVVTNPDGTPKEGELIELSAASGVRKFSRQFVTDSAGVIQYTLCDGISENISSISLEAKAVNHNSSRYQPTRYKTVQQWFSPSLTYIQIPRHEQTLTCGQNIQLRIPFTTREDKIQFHYQVLARGKVISKGKVSYDGSSSSEDVPAADPSSQCLQEVRSEELSPVEDLTTAPPLQGQTEDPLQASSDATVPSSPELPPDSDSPPPPPPFVQVFTDKKPKEKIVRSEFLANKVSSFALDLSITAAMSPKFTLLIYHVLSDGEVVADSMKFQVQPCFENTVKMSFDKESVLPGESVNIELEAAPESICGVGIIDKSLNILGGQHQIKPELIFQKIEEYNSPDFADVSVPFWGDGDYCTEKMKTEAESEMDGNFWQYFSQYVDASQAFKSSGLLVLSNLNLETRPCSSRWPVMYEEDVNFDMNMVPALSAVGPVPIRKAVEGPKENIATRTHFPETWLWDIQIISQSGRSVIDQTAPHTITSWVGNALCMDADKGFGLSNLTTLVTFQPFFLSLQLPYAAVRGERLPIMFTVYNYLDKCLHIQLHLDMGSNFEVHNSASNKEPICVCGGDSYTAKFYVTPKKIGSLPIKAKAEIIPGFCSNTIDVDTSYIGLSDAVERTMLVKAEGVEQQYSHTMYLCTKNGEQKQEDVILPMPADAHIVRDSARGEVKVIGDIMGPALNNLEHLVQMPTGCGEQNMVGFVPNIFVLKYLTSTGQITDEIKQKAVKFMEIGYQRELTFRHNDGSYSAFGPNENNKGSIWLTAFVVKSYAQAQPYIYIDQKDLTLSMRFLHRNQMETGCYRETGKVLSSYMMGGLGKDKKKGESFTALTAYVMIALLTAGADPNEPGIFGAVQCINEAFDSEKDSMDAYVLSLVAYAYALYKPNSPKSLEILEALDARAHVEDTLKYWGKDEDSRPKNNDPWHFYVAPSAEVEMTSYALLANLIHYGPRAIENTHKIAMWLSKQRNPFGGFSSTQDTVMGLSALSEFASLSYTEGKVEMKISVSGQKTKQAFSVSQKDGTNLLMQSARIGVLPNKITTVARGSGCALVQLNVFYNKLPKDLFAKDASKFHLKVTRKHYRHDVNKCNMRTLEINVGSKENINATGMGLVIIKMVTGWSPVPESLTKLKSLSLMLGLKKIENNVDDGTLSLYFDGLKNRKVFSIDVEQNQDLAVSNPRPAFVKVSLYYEPDLYYVESYDIKPTCGTKEEIPRIPIPIPASEPLIGSSDFPMQTRVSPADGFQVPQVSGCPMCIKIALVPENFKAKVCNSTAAYKAQVTKKGVKLQQNLRPTKIVKSINILAETILPQGCKCDVLTPDKKVVLLVKEPVTKANNKIQLNEDVTVIIAAKSVTKAVRDFQKSCRLT